MPHPSAGYGAKKKKKLKIVLKVTTSILQRNSSEKKRVMGEGYSEKRETKYKHRSTRKGRVRRGKR